MPTDSSSNSSQAVKTLTDVLGGVSAVGGGAASGISAGLAAVGDLKWVYDTKKLFDAYSDKKLLKMAEKDPIVGELLQRREILSGELIKAQLAQEMLNEQAEQQGLDGPEKDQFLSAINEHVEMLDQAITAVVNDPRMIALQRIEADADLASHLISKTTDHALSAAGKIQSSLSSGISLVNNTLKTAAPFIDAASQAANVVGPVVSVASIPLGASKTVLSAIDTVREGMSFNKAGKVRDNAAAVRQETDDPMLAAIAKRVEMKQDKNRIHHALATGSAALGTVAGAATVVAGTTGVIAAGMGAGTMGAGAAPAGIVAVAAGGTAAVTGGLAAAAAAGVTAYDVGRHFHSKEHKNTLTNAINGLRKLQAAGMDPIPDLNDKETRKMMEKAVKKDGMMVGAFKDLATKVGKDSTPDMLKRNEGVILTPGSTLKGQGSEAKGPSVRGSLSTNHAEGVRLTSKELDAIREVQKHGDKHFAFHSAADKVSTGKLLTHACEMQIARDSMTAAKHLANCLRTECADAYLKRGNAGIVAADLPRDGKAVNLARKLGMDDAAIVRVVNAVSNQDTLKVGTKSLKSHVKLGS